MLESWAASVKQPVERVRYLLFCIVSVIKNTCSTIFDRDDRNRNGKHCVTSRDFRQIKS